jgi:hypothetical protein
MYEHFYFAFNELYQNNHNSKIIVLGDFNLPSLIWSNTTLPVKFNSNIESYFISMLSQLNLNQYNCIRNHKNVSLDLVLSNVHVNVSNDPDPLLPIHKHHPA